MENIWDQEENTSDLVLPVCFSLYYLFSVALIVVGAVNVDKCPAQPKIPMWAQVDFGYLFFAYKP